jgi:hypothetical protein
MMQVLADLAAHVDVPERDVIEGRVPRMHRTAEQEQMFPPLFKVHHGAEAPKDAYASVKYRDAWFWIDDRDLRSKAVFSFIMFMFSLTETGTTPAAAPVMTVPTR